MILVASVVQAYNSTPRVSSKLKKQASKDEIVSGTAFCRLFNVKV